MEWGFDHKISELEEWMQKIQSSEVIPYFQPIFSVESGAIFGYEVLARLQSDDSKVESLGPLFSLMSEVSLSQEYKAWFRKLDSEIRKKALIKFSQFPELSDSKIFLNFSPNHLLQFMEEAPDSAAEAIDFVYSLGLEPSQIVIELTEESVDQSIDSLLPLLELCRREGFWIALDDLGSKSSNLDRLGAISPNIIKVDLQLLRKSVLERNYREILLNLSHLAESIGASLLFEGVETMEQLLNSFEFGSRFLQGYFFSEARESFFMNSDLDVSFPELRKRFYLYQDNKLRQEVHLELVMQKELEAIQIEVTRKNGFVELHFEDDPKEQLGVFRVYVTDIYGTQVSPNYSFWEVTSPGIDQEFLGKNWSWRPYFFQHHYHSKKYETERWHLSRPYKDLGQNLLLRTYSRTLEDGLILFIDVRI